LCHLQHKLIGFYNRDEKCLQRGTDWVFKYSSLRFVFKGLMQLSLDLGYQVIRKLIVTGFFAVLIYLTDAVSTAYVVESAEII
jgi:hypothetical protein